MKIGILKEPDFEHRVALLPEAVKALKDMKIDILIEKDAGLKAFAGDQEYVKAGAMVVDGNKVKSDANVLLRINPLKEDSLAKLNDGQVVISVFNPLSDKEIVDAYLKSNQTAFSMDMIPRTTRGQAMDILSSMATIAGYKAVLDAALKLPNFFPMFMSAAGTIRPAKILILGAGVAGLQAIATARKLGGIVEVFDVRSAVKEQVESLGGKFVEVEGAKEDSAAGGYAVEQDEEFKKKQKQLIHDHASKSNVVICTAQIPGRKAPLLIEKHTVEAMKPGSVIIDLAASTGGNCELTENEKTIVKDGVIIVGNSSYPSEMPNDASRMYGNNLLNFLKIMIDEDGELQMNFEDEIIKGTCMTHNKELVSDRLKDFYNK
ncbi:MAG: Re/Si-specific NAD(P)(+) transhydrogenase subunit alpha [Bacteroidales bacterium]|jgi:H+-translocating NAD(P) transhydrogenase subunit alpha|nr:NAD(P)(+) transhydrogenase (Re/Si-specific) subunit alpha [Lentimicrobiaceae bacterium]MDG1135822.1 Re/Si-specific NAD(P)(+) transhydrogenase subunit alpha [Bacteroidales bacterium]MDG1902040.1 Re/Si-specific NAD(P)(+) transhydrogenase subunit alpha [Bacteroidales bacterium]MDG2081480.1 Re/Si-specific NAD(P)(+) transhydrogenase subunit alpha [Bacteroidales bacterium]|tara:strand:- start:1870 stop:2997 length:1128 start_codon:yes stop_codon:yes gene_type:complete